MAQIVQSQCPHCRNSLRIPSDWLGKTMRCKFCQNQFQSRIAPAKAAVAVSPAIAAAIMASPAIAAPVAASPVPSAISADPPLFQLETAPFTLETSTHFAADPEPAIAISNLRTPKRKNSGKGWLIGGLLLGCVLAAAGGVIFFAGPHLSGLFGHSKKSEQVANADGGSETKSPRNPDNSESPDPSEPPKKKGGLLTGGKKKNVDPPTTKKVGPKTTPGTGTAGLFPRRALLINVNNYLFLNSAHYGSKREPGYPGSSTKVLTDQLSQPPMYFPATQIFELSDGSLNAHPTQRGVIETTIADFCSTSREQDRVLLLFAGHAVEIEKEAYLVPLEGNPEEKDTLIPLKFVYDELAKCKARQKLLILDVFRFPPARGYELPGTGEMTEDFEKKLAESPAGVQVWASCSKGQQAVEFEAGSVFMQAMLLSLQERLGGIASPADPLPIDNLVAKVNQRMKELLMPAKLEQVSKLYGKEASSGAEYDATQPLAAAIQIKPPVVPGGDSAGHAAIDNILAEIKMIPAMKASLEEQASKLRAATLPAFSSKAIEPYKADYKTLAELSDKVKKDPEKYPLRAAFLEAKAVLAGSQKIVMREQLAGSGPLSDKAKAAFLKEQEDPGLMIFTMEKALGAMKEAAELRDKEESKRWQANFDYAYARLQARYVYVFEYNFMLAQIRSDSLPTLEPFHTGWRIGSRTKVSVNESKVKDTVKSIGKLWKRVAEENPGTPWAVLATRESRYAMGQEWRPKQD
ncbi:MAG: caspase family protein [Gemmataceae bacterium]